jgi:hypothetical protein
MGSRDRSRSQAGLAGALLACALGCSTRSPVSPTEEAGAPCVPYADDASLATPTVSFKADVIPIFEQSCGLSSQCHSDPSAIAVRGVYLGCQPTVGTCAATGDPSPAVYAELLGPDAAAPLEESCMPFIKPGDPTKSYLMYKMDGNLTCVSCCIGPNKAAGSVGMTGCASVMPYLSGMLAAQPVCGEPEDCGSATMPARDTVRAWIKQGALNN